TANGATYTKFVRKSGDSLTLGTVVAKSNTPPTPGKTAEEKAQAMGVGSVANYTIQVKMPNMLGKADPMFKIMDKPGVGLTVNNDIKVYVEGGSSTITVDGETVNVTEIPADNNCVVNGFTANELKGQRHGPVHGRSEQLCGQRGRPRECGQDHLRAVHRRNQRRSQGKRDGDQYANRGHRPEHLDGRR
ncbi:MAG: isopeptide-forming domain-containing fimbrial protein, partial [Bifidobacterium dentium]